MQIKICRQVFALSVDAHLNAFATIDELLVAGKEDAAQREWTVVITAIDEQVAKESADLETLNISAIQTEQKAADN